jgi:Rps23 Pro-64 3,4-dihydroxylase Tpa1-like proline 4-hydroxylase
MDGIAIETALPSTIDGGLDAPVRRHFTYASPDAPAREQLHRDFKSASPFPHLVMDRFLTLPAEVVSEAFPDPTWQHWKRFQDAYQHQKRACSDIERLPALFQDMVHELSSPTFLAFLEGVTGIRGLIPDPYLTGGGLHSSGPGGILAPHADFHSYGKMALYRRINVLVYLNPEWREEYGGCLELFRKGDSEPTASIVPVYGRMVMFITDDQSIHGFTKPVVGEDRWRNSLALYYYTSEDTADFAGDGVTYWQQHGKQRGLQMAQLVGYKVLQRGAWMLSKAAHRLNPNLKKRAS